VFVFVINGECSVQIPPASNIIVLRRPNVGYDFGAYAHALENLPNDPESYQHFFFMNTSVRGPFQRNDSPIWQHTFIEMMKGDVKLVGTTINIHPSEAPYLAEQGFTAPFSHVQSQMFAMDKDCLEFLKPLIFNNDTENMHFSDVIVQKEVAMSQYVLQNNWNINCCLPAYKDIDYRKVEADINPTSHNGDPCYVGGYFGSTFTPYDVVFIKTNRGLLNFNVLTDHDRQRNNAFPHGVIESFTPSNGVCKNVGVYISLVLVTLGLTIANVPSSIVIMAIGTVIVCVFAWMTMGSAQGFHCRTRRRKDTLYPPS
jgi:hypothetical protein